VTKMLTELPQSDPRDLLLGSLPCAVEIEGEKRHPFQTEVLKMASGLLKTVHTTAVETRAIYVAHADDVAKNVSAVKETYVSCNERHRAAAMDRDECAALALQAEESHANAEYEQSRSETARARIMEERDIMEAEKSNSAKFLDCGWEGMDGNVVQEQLQAIGAEPALIAAAPGALAVPAEQRGAFDTLATQAMTAVLKERAEQVESMLQKNKAAERTAASFALGAWAFADVAKGQATVAAEKVALAETSVLSVTAELKKSTSNVTAQERLLQAALCEKTLADEKVQEIDFAMDELQHVIEHDTPPQPVAVLELATEPAVETKDTEMPLVSPKELDLPANTLISPETISIGGC